MVLVGGEGIWYLSMMANLSRQQLFYVSFLLSFLLCFCAERRIFLAQALQSWRLSKDASA
jgi:uncharacterized membrane protein YraQ (UPF0718 family)